LVGLSGLAELYTIGWALKGRSIARFGDGELNVCHGKDARFQRYSPGLEAELKRILVESGCLVCVPTVNPDGPRYKYWKQYMKEHSGVLDPEVSYGSAFISRIDEAPWLDTEDYRELVRGLWRGKKATLLRGRSSPRVVEGQEVIGPDVDAYDHIDELEKEIGTPEVAILCLGATATCLADRLSRKGVHAVDLGNIGLFM